MTGSVTAPNFPSLPLGKAQGSLTQTEAEILAFEHQLALAQTMEALTSLWSDDSSLFDISPGAIIGLKKIRENLAKQYSYVRDIKTTILHIRVEAETNLGVAYSVQKIEAHGVNGAPDMTFNFRMTNCFRKQNGRWLLFHQHVSLPADLSTGGVVLDAT
ncbi:MAG: nuclear transport factor 2 family protein [Caulobacterales bacterium]